MAVHQHQPLDEARQLRAEAAQVRLRSIRSQIAIALTFCSVAEWQLETGHAEHVDAVLAKLQKLAATVRRHLNEPNHVPSNEVERVRIELAQLESRTLAVEERARRNR